MSDAELTGNPIADLAWVNLDREKMSGPGETPLGFKYDLHDRDSYNEAWAKDDAEWQKRHDRGVKAAETRKKNAAAKKKAAAPKKKATK